MLRQETLPSPLEVVVVHFGSSPPGQRGVVGNICEGDPLWLEEGVLKLQGACYHLLCEAIILSLYKGTQRAILNVCGRHRRALL